MGWILFGSTFLGLLVQHLYTNASKGKLSVDEIISAFKETGIDICQASQVGQEIIADPKLGEVLTLIEKVIQNPAINNDATVEIMKALIEQHKN